MLTDTLKQHTVRTHNGMAKNLALKIAIIQSERSQIEVAKLADVPESRLSKLVNGHDDPTEGEMKALAKILKRKPAELFPAAVA